MDRLLLALAMWTAPIDVNPDPSLHDAQMFVCYETARANQRLADAHCDWLEEMVAIEGWRTRDCLDDWLMEAKHRREIWRMVVAATCPYYHSDTRRSYLGDIKREVGWVDYYRGCLPPPVPLEYFREIK